MKLVLAERTVLSEGRDFGVLSLLTWRLAYLGVKHAFRKATKIHIPLNLMRGIVNLFNQMNVH